MACRRIFYLKTNESNKKEERQHSSKLKSFNNWMFLVWFLFLSVISIIENRIVATASDMPSFTAKAILPENQTDKTNTFFDLKMEKGAQQTVYVQLTNFSDEPITVITTVHSAATSRQGTINYTYTGKLAESMQHPLTQIMKPSKDETITIAADSSEKIPYTISVPSEGFNGIILGGIHIKKKEHDGEKKAATGIENRYSYTIGVRLAGKNQTISPKLELEKMISKKDRLKFYFKNEQPQILNRSKLVIKLKKETNKKTVLMIQKDQLAMAPNSIFEYDLVHTKKKLANGRYIAEINWETPTKSWQWKKGFVVKEEPSLANNSRLVAMLIVIIMFCSSYFILKNSHNKN